jgi:arylsulfatase A
VIGLFGPFVWYFGMFPKGRVAQRASNTAAEALPSSQGKFPVCGVYFALSHAENKKPRITPARLLSRTGTAGMINPESNSAEDLHMKDRHSTPIEAPTPIHAKTPVSWTQAESKATFRICGLGGLPGMGNEQKPPVRTIPFVSGGRISMSFLLGTFGLCCLLSCLGVAQDHSFQDKPNFIFILADDLGWGELGCYGQEKIRTPHLDRLAAEGIRFTQFYAGSPVCAPSRCVLLTGKHSGHAYIRNNSEVKPEGQLPIPDEEITLAELLKQAGYTTAIIGKWGLGPPGSSGDPLNQGFDFFFGYNCQRHAHNHYPTFLYRNRDKVRLDNPDFPAHQSFPPDLDPNDPKNYARYLGKDFAPDLMTEEALKFIRENREKPFFLYFATTIPHLALQVPEDSLQEYLGKFPETPYLGDRGYLPHYAPRAAYAAMITRLDAHIGKMLALLDELGIAERTVIFFSSDNGPTHGRGPENLGVGGTDTDFFRSAGPWSGRKGTLFEGGIRVPLIVRWRGKISPGRVTDHMAGFQDVLPTILDIIGRQPPPDCDGISFLPTLLGQPGQKQHPYLVWEFYGYGGQQAVRLGRWKGIRIDCYKNPTGPLQLYDLETDPTESRDIASAHPDIVAKMEEILRREHTASPHWDFAKRLQPRPQ